MKDSSQPQPTQSTSVQLSPEQQELMNTVMAGTRRYAANVPQRYQGSTTAGFDPAQVAGQEKTLAAADNQSDLVGFGNNLIKGVSATNYTPALKDYAAVKPDISGYINAATRPIAQNFRETVLPGIGNEAVTTGNFGSSRQGIAEGLASGRMSQAIGDVGTKVAEDVYGTDVNAAERNYEANVQASQAANDSNIRARLAAIGALPQQVGLQLAPGSTTSAVGDVRQALAQAGINQNVANFNYDQIAPWLQTQDLASILSGLPGGTTVSTGNNPSSGPGWQSAMGGALSGAALGTAMFPGVGTAVGAGAGALLPFLFKNG